MQDITTMLKERAKAAQDKRKKEDPMLRRERIAIENGSVKKKKSLTAAIEKAGIQKKYSNTTFDSIQKRGFNGNEELQENFLKAKDYANKFSEHLAKGVGLTFMGDYGTLKTTLAVAVMRQVMDMGNTALFIPMCSLMDNLFTMSRLDPKESAEYEKRIRNIKLLVIDDLGSENLGVDWIRAKIDSIITERHNKMLPTIVTTNLTFGELEGNYNGRIIDRLQSTNFTITHASKSQRNRLGEYAL